MSSFGVIPRSSFLGDPHSSTSWMPLECHTFLGHASVREIAWYPICTGFFIACLSNFRGSGASQQRLYDRLPSFSILSFPPPDHVLKYDKMRWLSGGTTIPWRVLQAGDRAHRIGQKKAVLVLVLVAAGTIEEAILDRAQQKRDIDAKVIQVGHTPTPCWCLFRLLPLIFIPSMHASPRCVRTGLQQYCSSRASCCARDFRRGKAPLA